MSPNSIAKDLSPRWLARQKSDLHISGMAGFLFAICLLADIIGTTIITNRNPINQVLPAVWSIGWLLVGVYFLFSLKVASQWEKGVVLRMGKIS